VKLAVVGISSNTTQLSSVTSTTTSQLVSSGINRLKEQDWAAPEQLLLNSPSSSATDVYRFGVVLWALMTGSHPWASGEHWPTKEIKEGNFLKFNPLPHTIPDVEAKLVQRCLFSDPPSRPSMHECLLHLDIGNMTNQ